MQDEDNKKYLEKVYDTPSDKISNEQNSIYNRYKRLVNSNLDSLKKFILVITKNLYLEISKTLIQ